MSSQEQLPDPDEFGRIPPQSHEQQRDSNPEFDLPHEHGHTWWRMDDRKPLSDYRYPRMYEGLSRDELRRAMEKILGSATSFHDATLHEPTHFGDANIAPPVVEPAKPIEKPKPYPSRAGWRADYLPPHDPSAEDAVDKPKGKIGDYDIIESATSFDDVGGNAHAKDLLTEIAAQFEAPELYAKWDVPVPKGVLLHGGPGTGKTMMAKAFANAANAAFVDVPVAGLRDKYYGESEKRLKNLFDEAAKYDGQVVIFFDEIDDLLQDRSALLGGGPNRQLVNTFLQAMDGMSSAKNVMVLGATNFPDGLDSAATRPGRFDQRVEVELPDRDGCREIAAKQLLGAERKAGRVLAEDELNLEEVSQYMGGLSGAEIAEVLNRVKRTMVQTERAMGKPVELDEKVPSVSFEDEERDSIRITTDDIVAATINYRMNG